MVDRQSLLNEVLANARQQCDRGPCARGIGEPTCPPPIFNVHVWAVPNRLYGATINHEGDAI